MSTLTIFYPMPGVKSIASLLIYHSISFMVVINYLQSLIRIFNSYLLYIFYLCRQSQEQCALTFISILWYQEILSLFCESSMIVFIAKASLKFFLNTIEAAFAVASGIRLYFGKFCYRFISLIDVLRNLSYYFYSKDIFKIKSLVMSLFFLFISYSYPHFRHSDYYSHFHFNVSLN